MKQLWQESRGNVIGGLVVLVVTVLFTWLANVYASVGIIPLIIGGLILLWVGFLSYLVYWFWKRRRVTQIPISDNPSPNLSPSTPYPPDPNEKQVGIFYPCFISYSHKDETFVERLHADLITQGVNCWFATHDMRIGDKIRPTIDRSIQEHDKLLLILSEHSINGDWVEAEVETAFEKESRLKEPVLFPIRLDDAVIETDQAWAAHIRRTRHIGDFCQWKDDEVKKLLSDYYVT